MKFKELIRKSETLKNIKMKGSEKKFNKFGEIKILYNKIRKSRSST